MVEEMMEKKTADHSSNNLASDFDFSARMKELEEITTYLEQSDVDLDTAIQRFERGAVLARELKDYLSRAESKVNQLKEDFSTKSAS